MASLSGPLRTGSRSGWPVHSPGTPRPTLPPMLHTCAHAHSRGSFPGQSTGAVGVIESHRLVQVTPVRVDFLTVKSTLQSVSEKISSADAEKKLKEKKRSRRQRKGGGKGQKSAKIGCGQPRAAHWPQRVANIIIHPSLPLPPPSSLHARRNPVPCLINTERPY